VLAAAASPDGKTLAMAGHDRVLHVLDGRSLAPRQDQIPAGVSLADWNTYLPSLESPVAISLDGTLLASSDAEQRIILRRLDTGATIAALDDPFHATTTSSSAPNASRSAPMAILIEDRAVTVAYDRGVARWGCTDTDSPPVEPPLTIRFASIPALTSGMPSPIQVAVTGGGASPILRRILTDGQAASYATLADSIDFGPTKTGTLALEAKADDGIEEASSAAQTVDIGG
jgi:hypothetical protein